MTPSITFKERWNRFRFFFPFQLVFIQIKKNLVLLLVWGLLFGFVSESISVKYGVPYLFLSPEYLGNVGFWSFLILGFCIGAFIMSFNIASYVTNGSRFPFLATLNRPFMKYCINNFIIPLIFLSFYIYCIVLFQLSDETRTIKQTIKDILGLLSGCSLFVVFSYIYFFSTNKNLFQLFGIKESSDEIETQAKLESQEQKRSKLLHFFAPPLKWASQTKVLTYLGSVLNIRLARDSRHYKSKIIIRVFNQNQNNAARFQLIFFIGLMLLGVFKDYKYFEIPAAGSIVLLFTLILLIVTLLSTWFRGWFSPVVILLAFIINYISQFDYFDVTNKAYGLNYSGKLKEYNNESIFTSAINKPNYVNDSLATIEILKKWKTKNTLHSSKTKPKLLFVNCSGGGLKSTLWTFKVLQFIDSLSNETLFDHTMMITGSSGGIIGSAYFRELYKKQKQGEIIGINNPNYVKNISHDLLNPVAFSLILNDLFFKLTSFEDGENTYTYDRGYAFEKSLNENTKGILDNRLGDYIELEKNAIIPLMIFSPTVVNDGRRLLISSQPISYLTYKGDSANVSSNPLIEEIEFSRFFKEQDAMNLKLTTALRMSSTFPYIMPLVAMPTQPTIECMDAGARDNFGIKTTIKFISVFSEWIEENTSGVVIIQTRERNKEVKIYDTRHRSLSQSLSAPVGSLYENLFNIQDYSNDEILQYAKKWFKSPLLVVDFEIQTKDNPVSLSWHLTKKEKKHVLNSLYSQTNTNSIIKLCKTMGWRAEKLNNPKAE